MKVSLRVLRIAKRRGIPLGSWKDRLNEYLGERGINGKRVLEQARREHWDRERCDSSAVVTPWGYVHGGSKAPEL